MRFVAIVLLCILAAIVYGVLHDQVTARVCVEYFTVFHPPVFHTEDPTLLGLGWGVIATWWVGLILGVALAIAARSGQRPKLEVGQLLRPLVVMLAIVGMTAGFAGVAGYLAAVWRWVWLIEPLASQIARDRHQPFIADLWAHTASYGGGFIGGIVLCIWAVRKRRGRLTEQ